MRRIFQHIVKSGMIIWNNLANVNLDGVVDLVDACGVLKLFGRQLAVITIFENK